MCIRDSINIEIGGNIQVAREQAGYTQDTLSEMLGMTPNHLSAIERGASGISCLLYTSGSDLDRAKLISGGVNFILGKSVAEYDLPDNEKTQNVFIKEALLLKQALSLCKMCIRDRFISAFLSYARRGRKRLQWS